MKKDAMATARGDLAGAIARHPFFGRGLSHDLVRTCSPLPHDSELSPHFDQFCQPPSTTSEIFSETNCRKIQNHIALKAK